MAFIGIVFPLIFMASVLQMYYSQAIHGTSFSYQLSLTLTGIASTKETPVLSRPWQLTHTKSKRL